MQITREVMEGTKFVALAISEAFAGSDVAGLRCTAKKSDDGKWWIVNGTKKWITNGTFADYFTVGDHFEIPNRSGFGSNPFLSFFCFFLPDCLSHWKGKFCQSITLNIHDTHGGALQHGLTMIIVPRGPGVETKPIKTSYSSTAGTAFVTFDDVRVPIENTLGEVDKGLKVILSNFNHERWGMIVNCVQMMRNIVDETLR